MITICGVRGSATVVMDSPVAAILVVFWQSERFNAHNIGLKPYDLFEKFGFAEIDFFLGGNYVKDCSFSCAWF